MNRWTRWLLLAVMVGVSPLLATGHAAASDHYLAIAFSQSIGTYGSWHKAATREQAEEGALQECGRDCTVVIWSRNACAALAIGKGHGYGTFWSTDEDAVPDGAVAECGKQTSGCEFKLMVCSDH